MKKSWFDRKLFLDGFSQLSVSGLICGFVLALEVVLIPVGKVLSAGGMILPMETNLWELNPLVLLVFCAIAPLMALYLFRFLSHRNACDFYHAIPQTRECLYVSFSLAVFAWAMILQWGPAILGILIHLIFPRYFHVQIADILVTNLSISACVIFVLGAVMLAVTLTGNALTNLVVSLLIIFFPRLLMLVIRGCVGGSLFITGGEYLPFLGNGWNLVTSTVFGVADISENLYRSVPAFIYTVVIGLIYFLIGGVMFSRRRSEAAGEASIHPVLQMVFRLIPAGVFCLIPNVQIFESLVGHQEMDAFFWYGIGCLYLIGVLIYFIYELVSTRKLRNLPKAVPGLVFLAAFNLLVIFGMVGMRRHLLSFSPSASEIESVRIVGGEVYVMTKEEDSVIPGYYSSKLSEIELSEQDIRELIALRLAETIEYDESGQVDDTDVPYQAQEVAIRTHGRTTYRRLRLLQTDARKMAESLYHNPEVPKIYMSLPDAEDPNVALAMNINDVSSSSQIKQETWRKIETETYAALKEDVQDMGFEGWYAICNDAQNTGTFTLYMRSREKNKATGLAVPINEKTPKALAVALKYYWEAQGEDRKTMKEKVTALSRQSETEDVKISYCDANIQWKIAGQEEWYDWFELSNKEAAATLAELLTKQENIPVDPEKGFIVVNLNVEYYAEGNTDGTLESGEYESFWGSVILAAPEDVTPYKQAFKTR